MNGRFSRLEFRAAPEEVHTPAEQSRLGTPVRNAEFHMRTATDAYRRGQFEPALQSYTRALHIDRGQVAAWVGQVQMLVELGEYPEARLWAGKALEVFKNNGDILAARARACAREGDRRGATASSDAATASPGSSPLRWQARGEVMLATSPDRARDCFDRSLTEPQADWFDRIVIARIYLFHRRPAPGQEFARAAVDRRPDDPYAWLILGQSQEMLGWADKAEVSYERSLQLPGDHRDARRALDRVRSYSRAGRLARWFKGRTLP